MQKSMLGLPGRGRPGLLAAALLAAAGLLLWLRGDLRGVETDKSSLAGRLGSAAVSAAGPAPGPGPGPPLPPLPPPPPPPSVEAIEAEVVAAHCSKELRTKAAAAAANGSNPYILGSGWNCGGLEQCSGKFVSEQVARWRAMPQRYQSLLDMVPCDLYQAIRNRTLWVVGDSNAQRFYKQVSCFLAPFQWPHGQNVHDLFTVDPDYTEVVLRELVKGWEGAGVGMPYCIHLLGGTRLCHLRVNFGDYLLHVMKNLHILNARPQHDIVTFNFGLWHNKRKHYISSAFGIEKKWVPGMDAQMIQSMADFWKQNKKEMPVMIWRDHSPQHFNWEHGEYPHPDQLPKLPDRKCYKLPVELLPDGTLVGNDTNVLAGGWRNIVSMPVWRASGIPIQHTWNDTILMHDGHSHAGDCTHFCSPGGYSVWIWGLWRVIEGLKLPAPAAQ